MTLDFKSSETNPHTGILFVRTHKSMTWNSLSSTVIIVKCVEKVSVKLGWETSPLFHIEHEPTTSTFKILIFIAGKQGVAAIWKQRKFLIGCWYKIINGHYMNYSQQIWFSPTIGTNIRKHTDTNIDTENVCEQTSEYGMSSLTLLKTVLPLSSILANI